MSKFARHVSAAQRDALMRQDLSTFIRMAFGELNPGTEYLHNWHIDLIADRLTRVFKGEITRLIINIPPRYLKSISASVAFPVWMLGLDPTLRIICASYSSELTEKLARDSLTLMQTPTYRRLFPRTRISSGRKAAYDFTTTAQGYACQTSNY